MSQPDCGRAIHAVLGAVSEKVRGAVVTRERADHGELLFTHPLHDALCKVEIRPPMPGAEVQTTTVAVMVADWETVATHPPMVRRLLRFNARLMTGAVSVLPMDAYERAVVFLRRVPTDALAAGDVLGTVDDLVWEWAQSGGASLVNAAPGDAPNA